MGKENILPTIRFAGFKDPWSMNKFGDIYSFKSTNSLSRDNLNYQYGIVKNIHYGDIHSKFNTLFDITKELVPYINSDINLSKINKDSYCKEGDLIFADASEDLADVGKSIEVINLGKQPLLSGLHTLLARQNTKMLSIGFGGYLMKSPFIRAQIQKLAQGTKVLSISASRIANINICLPKLQEQKKIVSFFSIIDAKINQLENKKELLEKYKKGVVQKIFTQELRFKDEKGKAFPNWEKKYGNQVFESVSNKQHNSDLPILAITQGQGAIPRNLIDFKISVTDKSIETYKVVEIGDFIISLRSFQGGIEYSRYNGICSPAYIVLKPILRINDHFFKHYFKTESYITLLNKKLEGIRDGKMVSYNQFSEIELPFPSYNEQTKIANFLSAIDEKINHCQTQIEQTEKWKKGLLQKMFC